MSGGILIERRTDNDGDGQIERKTFFDTNGLPKKSLHDLDRDGSMEVVRTYREGILCEQKKDLDQDGKFEIVTRFEDGEPVLMKGSRSNFPRLRQQLLKPRK